MRSFESIDAELSAITVRESAITRALEGVRAVRGQSLASVDAMLASLGEPGAYVAASSTPLDADALFDDVGLSRHSMLAPLGDEPMPVIADIAPSSAGDLAGLLEGSNSMLPPPSDEAEGALSSASLGAPLPVAVSVEDEYEEMRAEIELLDDEAEIEILEE